MIAGLEARLPGLRARYAEPHRRYHTLAHVEAMLHGLQELGPLVHWPELAELAIWYHDAVYDPAARDNEARSAALLQAEMAEADPAAVMAAAILVAATAAHALPPGLAGPGVSDCAYVLDLDLAILGAPLPAYDAYEEGIAAEYVPVRGIDAFRAGRAAFLRGMLARERLFLTPQFHDALDGPARANMERALRRIAA